MISNDDDDFVYVGFANKNITERKQIDNSSSSFPIKFSQVVGVKKEVFKDKGRWIMDFKFTTEEANWFYWDNHLFSHKKCKFYFELKTWGSKTYVKSKTFVNDTSKEISPKSKDDSQYEIISHMQIIGGHLLVNFDLNLIFWTCLLLVPVGASLTTI